MRRLRLSRLSRGPWPPRSAARICVAPRSLGGSIAAQQRARCRAALTPSPLLPPSLRCAAVMLAERQDAAALCREQRPRSVRCAAGKARRRQGGKDQRTHRRPFACCPLTPWMRAVVAYRLAATQHVLRLAALFPLLTRRNVPSVFSSTYLLRRTAKRRWTRPRTTQREQRCAASAPGEVCTLRSMRRRQTPRCWRACWAVDTQHRRTWRGCGP